MSPSALAIHTVGAINKLAKERECQIPYGNVRHDTICMVLIKSTSRY